MYHPLQWPSGEGLPGGCLPRGMSAWGVSAQGGCSAWGGGVSEEHPGDGVSSLDNNLQYMKVSFNMR